LLGRRVQGRDVVKLGTQIQFVRLLPLPSGRGGNFLRIAGTIYQTERSRDAAGSV